MPVGSVESHILRHMETQAPDSGCRAVCRLCEALWGQCGIVGWSARAIARSYEGRVSPTPAGVAAVRAAIKALETAGQVVAFSYAGCQGEMFAAPVPPDAGP